MMKASPRSTSRTTAGPPIGLPNNWGVAFGGVGRFAGPGGGAVSIERNSCSR